MRLCPKQLRLGKLIFLLKCQDNRRLFDTKIEPLFVCLASKAMPAA
jgi:hypothetical protein